MKKINPTFYLAIGIIVFLLAGFGYFVYSINANNSLAQKSENEFSEEYKRYLEVITKEMAEKEYGVPIKTEFVEQLPKNTKGEKWSIAVSLNSLNTDLILMEDNGQTPWMDHNYIDSELDKFEKAEKDSLSKKTATWQAIINDSSLSRKTIEVIQNVFIPRWEAEIKRLRDTKQEADYQVKFISDKFGENINDIPQKYHLLYQNAKDIGFIIADLIYLSELNLKVKDKTISSIKNKDVDTTVMGANDEDRISLITSWYYERLDILLQEYKIVFEEFKKSVEQGQ